MKVRVTNVDMNGLCGRDFHPRPEDVGRVGTVVDCYVDPCEGMPGDEVGDPLVLLTVVLFGDEGDGRQVELAEHEVSIITDTQYTMATRAARAREVAWPPVPDGDLGLVDRFRRLLGGAS